MTPDLVNWVIQRGGNQFGWLEPQKSQTTSRSLSFGFNVRGDLYYPVGTPENAKLPTVIWLHGYSYQLGYMWVYHNDLHPILALVKAGYAVLAFDQSGFGSRMSETGPFYDRYPHWSQMGRMVEDTRAAIDALQKDNMVDPERIYLFGYSLGGMVGLYTAALDSRVKGVVSICGFTPMRTDTAGPRNRRRGALQPRTRIDARASASSSDTKLGSPTISTSCWAPSRRGPPWWSSRNSIVTQPRPTSTQPSSRPGRCTPYTMFPTSWRCRNPGTTTAFPTRRRIRSSNG